MEISGFQCFHWTVIKIIGFHYFRTENLENQWFSLLSQEKQRKPAQHQKTKAVEVFWSTRGSPGQLPRQLPDAFGSWPGSWPGEPKNNKKASKLLFFFVFPCVLHHLPEGKCCKYQGKTKKQKNKCLERSLVNLRLPGPAPQDSSRASSRAGSQASSQAFGSWPGEPQNDQQASKLWFLFFPQCFASLYILSHMIYYQIITEH